MIMPKVNMCVGAYTWTFFYAKPQNIYVIQKRKYID